ncbi:hypothetical protein ARNL5_00162 [Anaerolineae bacterium]|nr:hypothetical protein ARNL5_00162 [Anaerolineae bacterium]
MPTLYLMTWRISKAFSGFFGRFVQGDEPPPPPAPEPVVSGKVLEEAYAGAPVDEKALRNKS